MALMGVMRLMKCFLTLLLAFVSWQSLGASLLFSSLLGSGDPSRYEEEVATGVAVDNAGYIYVVGYSSSAGFPETHHYGETNGVPRSFIIKLAPDGSKVIYSTTLANSRPRAVVADGLGQAYVTGEAIYYTFPTTNAIQTERRGDTDAFVAKLDPDGKLLFSTLHGGNDLEVGLGISLDSVGNILVAGFTSSTNMPVTANPPQKAAGGDHDGFVLNFAPDGSQRLLASYFGGTGRETISKIAAGPGNTLYIAGRSSSQSIQGFTPIAIGLRGGTDGFVAKLDPASGVINFLTFLGGSGSDVLSGLAFDKSGGVLVSGFTTSTDFPTTEGAAKTLLADSKDAFVVKLSSNLNSVVFSTLLGGVEEEDDTAQYYLNGSAPDFKVDASTLALDGRGSIYVSGVSSSLSFGAGVKMRAFGAFGKPGYVAQISGDGTRIIEVATAGSSYENAIYGLAVAGTNKIVAVGTTAFAPRPPFFPTTVGSLQPEYGGSVSDAFITELLFDQVSPGNDNRVNATEIKGAAFTTSADNLAATAEPQESTHAGEPPQHSVWWKWTAPANGRLNLSTEGSGFDTLLSFYSTNLQMVAENDDASLDVTFSRIKPPVAKGATYLIAVDGKSGQTGQILLTLMFSATTNDDFADRVFIPDYPAFVTGSNGYSSPEPGELYHAGLGRNSAWWLWTSPTNDGVIINTAGSSFPTLLAVYTGTNLTSLKEVSSAVGFPLAQTVFYAVKGSNYWIAVDGQLGATGVISLSVQKAIPPPNNDFTNATPVVGFIVDTTGTNLTAQIKAVEQGLFKQSGTAGRTIWWSWTCPTNGWAEINTLDSTGDPNLAVFTGFALTNLTLVADSDDGYPIPGNYQSRVFFPAAMGVTYSIRGNSSIYTLPGVIQLHIRLTQPPQLLGQTARLTGSGKFECDVKGVAGHDYTLQGSSNLKDWIDLPTSPLSGASFKVSILWQVSTNSFLRLWDKSQP